MWLVKCAKESESIDKVQLTLASELVAADDNTRHALYAIALCISLIDIRLTVTHTEWRPPIVYNGCVPSSFFYPCPIAFKAHVMYTSLGLCCN
jgi:hypothetical protein